MGETATAKKAEQLEMRREKAQILVAAGAVTFGQDEFGEVKAEVAGSQELPYVVTLQEGEWTCTCPDPFEPCKHILAVQIAREREDNTTDQPDGMSQEAKDALSNIAQVQPASQMVRHEPAPAALRPMTPEARIAANLQRGGMAVYEPTTFAYLTQMADYFARFVKTDFVPDKLKSKEAIGAAIFYGAEVGLSPMQAMQDIYIVNGRPSLSAQAMLALVGAKGDVAWRWIQLDDKGAKLAMRLKDGTAEVTVSFTLADAQRAGLAGKDVWKKYPEDMCASRCVSRAVRRVCPHHLKAIRYTPEEGDFGGTLVEVQLPPIQALPAGEEEAAEDWQARQAAAAEAEGKVPAEGGEWEEPSEKGTATPLMDQDTPGEALGFKPPVCEYCGATAVLRDSAVLYKGTSYGPAWICENYPECDAYVGAHEDGNKPLGRLANAELRGWKQKAHAAFDPLWKDGPLSRTEAYNWMADILGLTKEQAHIGELDLGMCKGLIAAVDARKATEQGPPEPEEGDVEEQPLPTDAHGNIPKDLEPESGEPVEQLPPDEAPDLSTLEDMTPRSDSQVNTCLRSAGVEPPWKPLKRAAMTVLYTTVPARGDVTPEMWTAIWLKVLDWSTSGKIEDVLAELAAKEGQGET